MSVAWVLTLAAAAAAQPDELATQAMHNFGACVVETTSRGARRVLAMDYRTPEYSQALRRLARGHGRCTPGHELRFTGVLFAGAMAEALLESDVKAAELPGRLGVDAGQVPVPPRSPTEAMALCTVRQAPQAVVHLLATEPASPEEAQADKALRPAMTECLRKGVQLNLNRPALRSVLALAAWRIASTAAAPK
jgi:hypothetical protein